MSALPQAWIDRIFAQLSAMYGNKFSAMWADSNAQAVKAIWAEKLGGFTDNPQAIKGALDSFDSEPWPPTLPEFLNACRTAAKRTSNALALPAPMSHEQSVKFMDELSKRSNLPKVERYDYKLWAKKIMEEPKKSMLQENMAREALEIKEHSNETV